MTSTNEEIPSSPAQNKRILPQEYRNTDLVSRLLAATPPYLYNMSLVPNTYFFSELLRSFVQTKSDRTQQNPLSRRSRKRSWTQIAAHTKTNDSSPGGEHHKVKIPFHDSWKSSTHSTKPNSNYYDETHKIPEEKSFNAMFQPIAGQNEPTTALSTLISHSNSSAQSNTTNNNVQSNNLTLPPPPPLWYPPLYTSPPFGIDPLHFFIDLRVSGHIYDRKKALALQSCDVLEDHNTTIPQPTESKSMFKSSKHASAFSVPTKQHYRPINLSKVEDGHRFDVKALGLLESSAHNKTGINYVMNNIQRVYKQLQDGSTEEEQPDTKEEGEKKRELKELIGLELAVDFMSRTNKMGITCAIDEQEAANEADGDSSVLEVVEIIEGEETPSKYVD